MNFCLDRPPWYLIQHVGINLLVEFLEVLTTFGNQMVYFSLISFIQRRQSESTQKPWSRRHGKLLMHMKNFILQGCLFDLSLHLLSRYENVVILHSWVLDKSLHLPCSVLIILALGKKKCYVLILFLTSCWNSVSQRYLPTYSRVVKLHVSPITANIHRDPITYLCNNNGVS